VCVEEYASYCHVYQAFRLGRGQGQDSKVARRSKTRVEEADHLYHASPTLSTIKAGTNHFARELDERERSLQLLFAPCFLELRTQGSRSLLAHSMANHIASELEEGLRIRHRTLSSLPPLSWSRIIAPDAGGESLGAGRSLPTATLNAMPTAVQPGP